MSSSAASIASRLATLPRSLFDSVIAPLLTTADLLALSAVDRATRRLILTPARWRHKVFTSLPPLSSTAPSFASWCDVVQVVHSKSPLGGNMVCEWPVSLDSLVRFSNLRHFVDEDRDNTRLYLLHCVHLPP